MAATLKLTASTTAELDLSTYLDVQEDAGLDPADGGFLAPAFNDSTIGAGQALVNIDTANKELVFSLQLKAASKDALHALVQTIRRKLDEPNLDVEWRDHGATLSTFYDLEFARLEPAWRYFKGRQNWVGASLHCWVRPYGHTATERIVATAVASGHGAPVMLVGSLAGDVKALGQYTITVASYAATTDYEAFTISVLPSPSYPFRTPAASMPLIAGGGASLIGEATAAGSQFIGKVSVATTGSTLTRVQWPFPGAMGGRHRVLANVRAGQEGGIIMTKFGPADPTPTYTATITATSWTLVDFGIWDVPSHVASAAGANLEFLAPLTASKALIGSYRWSLNEIYLVPEDQSCLLVTTDKQKRKYVIDGVNGVVSQGTPAVSGAIDIGSDLRGQVPQIPPAATVAIGILHAPLLLSAGGGLIPPAQSTAVELRVRERFSFQR